MSEDITKVILDEIEQIVQAHAQINREISSLSDQRAQVNNAINQRQQRGLELRGKLEGKLETLGKVNPEEAQKVRNRFQPAGSQQSPRVLGETPPSPKKKENTKKSSSQEEKT